MMLGSTRTQVTLFRPWIRRFTMIISAWWLRTSSKFTLVKCQPENMEKGQLLSGLDSSKAQGHRRFFVLGRIKIHQSVGLCQEIIKVLWGLYSGVELSRIGYSRRTHLFTLALFQCNTSCRDAVSTNFQCVWLDMTGNRTRIHSGFSADQKNKKKQLEVSLNAAQDLHL